MNDFYTTKVTLEVEISHQFGPEQAVNLLKSRLTGPSIPAVLSMNITNVKSNYVLHKEPLAEMIEVEID